MILVQDSLINRKFKITLIWDRFFFNAIKAFTVTFDQFDASLLNKSINFFQKDPNTPLVHLNLLHHQLCVCVVCGVVCVCVCVCVCVFEYQSSSQESLLQLTGHRDHSPLLYTMPDWLQMAPLTPTTTFPLLVLATTSTMDIRKVPRMLLCVCIWAPSATCLKVKAFCEVKPLTRLINRSLTSIA